MKNKTGFILLSLLFITSIVGLFFLDPIIQDETYHNFSDKRRMFYIPNFWNVASNLPFLVIGLLGIFRIDLMAKSTLPYLVFFIGITLCFFGSSYYHWEPNSQTLVWDRLPMTIAFMALIAIVISEFIDPQKAKTVLWPFIIIGFLSIGYWVYFGDLRPYVWVQFFPLLSIPIVIILFKSKYTKTSGYWVLFLFYILAKFVEYYDAEIYENFGFISGHSLKHIFASLGVFALYQSFITRKESVI